jgi:hypothetical protein
MPVSPDPAQLDAPADLITLLQTLPSRVRRGVRYPQWWMLLVAILAILSGQSSLVGMERFAKPQTSPQQYSQTLQWLGLQE